MRAPLVQARNPLTQARTAATRTQAVSFRALDGVPGDAILWLDAYYGVNSLSGPVQRWDSRVGTLIGAGLAPSQGTPANQPAYNPPSSGLPGVQFDGTNDELTFNANNLLSGAPGVTAFLVSSLAAYTAGDQRALMIGRNTLATDTRFRLTYAPGTSPNMVFNPVMVVADSGSLPNNLSVPAAAIGTPSGRAIDTAVVDLKNGPFQLRRNGVATTPGGSTVPNPGFFGSGTSVGGAVGSGVGSGFFNGTIHELIVYPRVFSSLEIGNVETYLKGKWGTP